MAKCYQYDNEGFYVCETDDFGGFLPSGAAYTKPSLKDGMIPRWDGENWSQIETHKGKEGYLNGQTNTIKNHGPLPNGWSETLPPLSEEDNARKRMAEIDSEIRGLEQKTLRPMLAIRAVIDDPYDTEHLNELTSQIIDLRCERQMLEAIADQNKLFA